MIKQRSEIYRPKPLPMLDLEEDGTPVLEYRLPRESEVMSFQLGDWPAED